MYPHSPASSRRQLGRALLLTLTLVALIGCARTANASPVLEPAVPLAVGTIAEVAPTDAPWIVCTTLRRDSPARRACIIRAVFGRDGAKAVSVATCESHLDPDATNGQYRGTFQLGATERRTYGHGPTILAQALAARRLHRARGWQPWACA